MTNHIADVKANCLTDEDLYSYLTRDVSPRSTQLEAHLTNCSKCRQALADLLKLLHPEKDDTSETIPELTDRQLQNTLDLIKGISSRKQSETIVIPRNFRWGIAAAIAISFVAVSVLGARVYSERRRSEAFFNQAALIISQSYTGSSPGNLRLSLPFSPTSTNRNIERGKSLRSAENLLFQALAIRGSMVEARLGLGFIYLSESDIEKARGEFAKILEDNKTDARALIGRGTVSFEEALQAPDARKRIYALNWALSDFNAVLSRDPASTEARYNKIQVLYELGLHQEALVEIELYMVRDSRSEWARKLNDLKTKLQLTQSGALERRVDHAARKRDRKELSELCRLFPHRMPSVVLSLLKRSLEPEQRPAQVGKEAPDTKDLIWAAETMEAFYARITEDHSLRSMIDFYIGLSPPNRILKRSLDLQFQSLTRYYRASKFDLLFDRILPLEKQYAQIRDQWQLFNLYHLRGNSLYMGKANFRAAETEYLKMLQIADQLGTPELLLSSLSALALIRRQQGDHDRSLSDSLQLRNLADKRDLEYWKMVAAMSLGNQYRRLGQSERALREYCLALSLASRISDPIKIAEALENSGILMDQEGRLAEAEELFELAIRQQEGSLGDPVNARRPEVIIRRLNLLLRKGDLALRVGETIRAQAIFRECLSSIQPGMAELEARTRLGLGEGHLQAGLLQKADAEIDKALLISESGQYWESIWKSKFLKGRSLELGKRPDKAIAFYEQSLTALEQMRRGIGSSDLKHSFLNNRYDPIKALVTLLLKSGKKERALEFVDRAKSATLREGMPRACAKPYSQKKAVDECPTLEYFFSNEQLLIFFYGSGRMDISSAKISSHELDRFTNDYLNSIGRNDAKIFAELSKRLYKELISPVEKQVLELAAQGLVILPDGPLHLLPFAGLMDEQGHFLVEKIPLSYASSKSVLHGCLSTPSSAREQGNPMVLLIDGTRSLPHAQDELAFLSKFYGTSLRTGANNISDLRGQVKHSDIVHFAGHADMEKDKPVLVLQDDPQQIHLDSNTIRKWDCSRAYLVNLAGCSTATGPLAAGEAPWGLIPAFLDAGARSVIASLLPVDDKATQQLNSLFYELLKNGKTKAEALQMAQCSLLQSARKNLDVKPLGWIPYVLIGNPH